MGKRGPKPTPTKTLEKRGSVRAKSPARRREVKPKLMTGAFKPPRWATKKARKYWPDLANKVAELGVAAECDIFEFARGAELFANMIEAWALVEKEGNTMVTGTGTEVVSAAFCAAKSYSAEFAKWCAKFGLSPADRVGLPAAAKGAKSPVGKGDEPLPGNVKAFKF